MRACVCVCVCDTVCVIKVCCCLLVFQLMNNWYAVQYHLPRLVNNC